MPIVQRFAGHADVAATMRYCSIADVAVESAPGVGSTFTVSLPRTRGVVAAESATIEAVEVTAL